MTRRLFSVVLIVAFMACSSNRRLPNLLSVEADEVVTVTYEAAVPVMIRSVNAFTAEDLYKSREKTLKERRRRAAAKEQVTEETEEVSEPVRRMVEIIQVIDDDGKVLAAKVKR